MQTINFVVSSNLNDQKYDGYCLKLGSGSWNSINLILDCSKVVSIGNSVNGDGVTLVEKIGKNINPVS